MVVPKLRFKGFNDEWNFEILQNIADIRKGDQINHIELKKSGNYYYLNGGVKPSGYVDNYNREPSLISISEGGSCGFVFFNESRFWAGGHLYTLEKIKYILNHKFLYFYLKSIENKIMSLGVGSTLKNIQKKDFNKLNINYSSSKEQTKIANFFDLIDKKIDLQNQKLKLLKDYKRGLLIKLFSKKNKMLNLINTKKLLRVSEINTGKLNANAMIDNGKYPFFTCSKKISSINEYAFDCEAILISGNGAVGYINYYKGKFNAYQRTYVLCDFRIDAYYLKSFLEWELKSILKGQINNGCVPYIVKSTLETININIYNDVISKNIGKLFFYLNKLVKLEFKKLKYFNFFKRSFLKKMFV